MRLLKVVSDTLFKNRRSKGAKGLALLDPSIQDVLHLGAARVDDDAPIAESPWPKLHPALEPTHDLPISDSLRCCLCELRVAQFAPIKTAPSHHTVDLFVGKLWTGIGVLHHKRPRLLQYDIVDVVTDSKGRAGVAGCRLHEQLSEWSVEQNLSVHHRVICDSTSQAKPVSFRLLMQLVQNVKANFLQAGLEGGRDILMQRGDRLSSETRRPEGIDKLVRENATDRRRAVFPRHVHAFRVVLEVVEV